MNKSRTITLRAIFEANLPFPDPKDARNRTMWRRLKRAYLTLPSPDRHPNRLAAALVRAIKVMTTTS